MKKLLIERFVPKVELLESDRVKLPEGVLCRVTYPICNIGEVNRNSRVYERDVWDTVMTDEDLQGKIKSRALFGHAEHPKDTSQSSTEKISHVVNKIWLDESGNIVKTQIDVLDTPYGRICDTLLKAGCGLGVSTRAEGELEEMDEGGKKLYKVIPEAYSLKTIDFTADPSTYGVYPESVERDLVRQIDTGVKEKKIDQNYACVMLESMKVGEAKKLLESITKVKECKASELHRFIESEEVPDLAGDPRELLRDELVKKGVPERDAHVFALDIGLGIMPDDEGEMLKEYGINVPQTEVTELLKKFGFEGESVSEQSIMVTAKEPDAITFAIDGKRYQYFGVTPNHQETFEKMLKHGAKFNALHWLHKIVPKENRYRFDGDKRVPIAPPKEEAPKAEPAAIAPEAPKNEFLDTTIRSSKNESFNLSDMFDKIKAAVNDLLSDKDKSMNECKTSSDLTKRISKLVREQVKHAAIYKAERDKVSEISDERIKELEDRYASDVLTFNEEIDKIKVDFEKRIKEMKDEHTSEIQKLKEGFEVHKQAFGERLASEFKNVYETKITSIKKHYETLIEQVKTKFEFEVFQKTVVDPKVQESGLNLPENAKALLRRCKSEQEVDTMLSDFRYALRESFITSDKPESLNADISEDSPSQLMQQTGKLVRMMK